jgi:hypothetical protein
MLKKLGDELMALFGYPHARENDAERGRCAPHASWRACHPYRGRRGPIKRMAKTLPLSFALGGGLMKGKFMLQGWKNTFALWLAKSEVDDARDQLRTIYAQTLNCACKAATQ